MALSITQHPADISLSQSPIVFTVSESNPLTLLQTGFQYIGELWYWQGEPTGNKVNPQYTLAKYKNASDVGIFEISRIINSLFTEVVDSNVWYYKMKFHTQYLSGSYYVTGTTIDSSIYKAIDGYLISPNRVTDTFEYDVNTDFPLMSRLPETSYFNNDNSGYMNIWANYNVGNPNITGVMYTKLYNGSIVTGVTIPISNISNNTESMIWNIPIGPKNIDWVLGDMGDIYDFTITPKYDYNVPVTTAFFKNTCNKKYPNIRLKWKNRFGCYDYFNFNMISRESFTVNNTTYQQQIGTWGDTELGYKSYLGSTKNYITDDEQTIQVNTDFIDEDYNTIFKEMMLSDEIYLVYQEQPELKKSILLVSNSIQLKTGVVDKLIQYSFTFKYAQPYKLIF